MSGTRLKEKCAGDPIWAGDQDVACGATLPRLAGGPAAPTDVQPAGSHPM